MPNWSFNRLSVHAEDENERAEVQRLRNFIKRVVTDEKGTQVEIPFSFQNVIPMPAELEGTRAPVEDPNSDENKALRAKYGYDNWYDWRWEHWGTKWDACDAEIEESDDSDLSISFDTAWSFPTPVVVELSKLFPTLTFCYDANEEGGLYDFVVNFKNGEVVYYADWEENEDGERVEVQKPEESFWMPTK